MGMIRIEGFDQLQLSLWKLAGMPYSVIGEMLVAGGEVIKEAHQAKIDKSKVIVDIPSKSTLLSSVKIGKTDVQILDGNKLRSVASFSPLAKSLQSRNIYDWSIMISAPNDCVEAVQKAARDTLGINDVTL